MDKWPGGQNGGNHCPRTKYRKKKKKKRNLWDNIKCTNICITRVPEAGEREKEPEKIFEEIIAENFPNTGKETVNQVKKESQTG